MATITGAAGGGNWSAGGSWVGGVAPGSGDDVLLIGTSGNVTVDGGAGACRSLNCTGYVGTLTIPAATTLTIGDGTTGASNVGLLLVAGMTLTLGNSVTAAITFNGSSATQQTITSGGKTIGTVTFANTGPYQLQDAFHSAWVVFTSGTLDTGGFACTWAGQFVSSGSATRVLTLGASAINATNVWTISPTGLTVSANTAVVTMSASSANMTMGDGLNWNGTTFVFTGVGVIQWTAVGATVGALTFAPNNPGFSDALTLNGNLTITGALTVTGALNGGSMRYASLRSNTAGTARTITAGSVALTNCLLTDITGAGAATWTGTLVGDCGGNTGITFTTPATQTWAGGSGNWSTVAQWTSRRPLPQDSVVIATGTTVTVDVPNLGGTINFTGFTGTFALAGGENWFGGVTLASGMTLACTTGVFNFVGSGSYTITSNGKAFPAGGTGLTFNARGGTYALGDDLSADSITTLTRTQTFTANNHNVTLSTAATFGAATTVNGGSGTWMINKASGTPWSANAATTINCSTSTIVFGDTSAGAKTFAGGGKTYGTLRYKATGSGALTITGNNTFAVLDLECTTARTITLPASGAQTVTGTLTLQGASGQLLTVVSSSPGTATTIKYGTLVNTNTSVSADVVLTALPAPVNASFSRRDTGAVGYSKAIGNGYAVGEATRFQNALARSNG